MGATLSGRPSAAGSRYVFSAAVTASLIASKTARLKLHSRILSASCLRDEPDWTPPKPAAAAEETPPRNEPKNDATHEHTLVSDEEPAPPTARPASQVVVVEAATSPTAPPRRL
jgi:hypothetical protein